MKHRTALLVLSVAIAGTFATACHRNDNDDADAAYDASTAPATTPDATAADAAAAMPGAMTDETAATAGTAMSGPIQDTDFYQQALDGGRKEVAAATLASTSASDAGVKSFADTLVKDHTAMNQQVAAAAGQADAAAPAPDASATADLQGKSGADFDRAFVDKMVADHQATIALFENAAQNASTEEAKSLAQGALPKLQEHLQPAQDLQTKLGGATGAGDASGTPGT
jgi:putative membrane protein